MALSVARQMLNPKGQKEENLKKTLVMFAVLALYTTVAHATVIYSTGFENPPFTLGALNGQNG